MKFCLNWNTSVVFEDKYQMPNLENLMDMVAEKIEGEEGEVFLFLSRFKIRIRTSSPT